MDWAHARGARFGGTSIGDDGAPLKMDSHHMLASPNSRFAMFLHVSHKYVRKLHQLRYSRYLLEPDMTKLQLRFLRWDAILPSFALFSEYVRLHTDILSKAQIFGETNHQSVYRTVAAATPGTAVPTGHNYTLHHPRPS